MGRLSIILVEPHSPGNIGSTARAMKNMGFSRLKVVGRTDLFHPQSLRMAGRARDLLAEAEIYGAFEKSVEGEGILVGTTSQRDRKSRRRVLSPREAAPLIRGYLPKTNVAIVFGPERRGLTEAQLARCQFEVSIPAAEKYPVLNLAQAVLILAYEIFLAEAPRVESSGPLGTDAERERLYLHLERVLTDIGFLSTSNPIHIMNSIRRFLGKADLSPRDLQILHGICSQMDWFVREWEKLTGLPRKP